VGSPNPTRLAWWSPNVTSHITLPLKPTTVATAAMPVNGRSYTDLLALQPGVTPTSSGQYGAMSVSGNLNPGSLSVAGQRESTNGFMVNGGNVVEGGYMGTAIIPNLDSIAEFRILTNNADAEYGNYSGGQINAITKSGANEFHGDVFEFLRNTDLDARNFYSPDKGKFIQNQFGATAGDKIWAYVFTNGATSSTDSQLTLTTASPTFTTLQFDDDDGSQASLSSAIAGAPIASSGAYQLKVNPFSAAATLTPYILYLDRTSGAGTPETEPNETMPTAKKTTKKKAAKKL
jgi:hypothetical protein